ncbi:hypothetical protein EDB92DRAFT_1850869, partial [Lactarius akahatsu]
HNPTIFYDSVTLVPSHLVLHRNLNDFAADITSRSGCFATLNMVNNGHDTTIDFAGQWVDH